ncbi:hypothetical protein [Thalassococcus sp. S3]|uniref:hypothetical protein n=1 Tax=Thalassococcus sp. S3 TaxID=2017482 RepID=UPI00102CCC9A|nr:hypothetical protein [Thalassococcus sp. S3]
MDVHYYISGSLIYEDKDGVVPTPGSKVVLEMQSYKKGLAAGSIIEFTVEGECCEPNTYDLNLGIVSIDVNGYDTLKKVEPES